VHKGQKKEAIFGRTLLIVWQSLVFLLDKRSICFLVDCDVFTWLNKKRTRSCRRNVEEQRKLLFCPSRLWLLFAYSLSFSFSTFHVTKVRVGHFFFLLCLFWATAHEEEQRTREEKRELNSVPQLDQIARGLTEARKHYGKRHPSASFPRNAKKKTIGKKERKKKGRKNDYLDLETEPRNSTTKIWTKHETKKKESVRQYMPWEKKKPSPETKKNQW